MSKAESESFNILKLLTFACNIQQIQIKYATTNIKSYN